MNLAIFQGFITIYFAKKEKKWYNNNNIGLEGGRKMADEAKELFEQVYELVNGNVDLDFNPKLIDFMTKSQPFAAASINMYAPYEIIAVNTRFCKELGISEEEALTQNLYQMVNPEDKEKLEQILDELSENEKLSSASRELRVRKKSNGSSWYDFRIIDYRTPGTFNYVGLVCIADISEKKKIEEDLKIQMERYNLVKDLSNEFIFEYIKDTDAFIIPRDMILKRGLKVRFEDGISCDSFETMVHPDDWQVIDEEIRRFRGEGETGVLEYRLNTSKLGKSPHYQWYRLFYKKIRGNNGDNIRVIGRNINIQGDREKASDMEERMRLDPMTGVLNKVAVEEEIKHFFNDEHPGGSHALIVVDVDDFKMVNDTFGHLFGDNILNDVASEIKGRFRSSDIVGRVGGDEFLICMKNTTADLAVSVATEICNNVSKVLRADQGDMTISLSIGICMYPDSGIEYTEMFKKAEIAMYTAKQSGKGTVRVFEKWGDAGNQVEVKTTKRASVSNYRMSVQSDSDFITMCFEMLAQSHNLNTAMNLLLEHVGKRYGLGGVSVFKLEQDENEISRIYKWTQKEGIYLLSDCSYLNFDMDAFKKNVDEDGRLVVDNVKKAEDTLRQDINVLLGEETEACVFAKYDHSETVKGYVAFHSVGVARRWSKGEKNFFSEFARVVAVFVALIDKQIQDDKMMAALMEHDQLTGMLNEDNFLKDVVAYKQEHGDDINYVFVNMDIDGFSYINENFGTSAGNQTLKEFARLFRFRDDNILTCRQFSDFFAAFFPNYSIEEVENLMNKVEKEFIERSKEYYPNSGLRFSIGLYQWEKGVPAQFAMENANMARKKAKESGNGKVVKYHRYMREKREKNRLIASKFHAALANDEFMLYIQPKFDLKTKKVIGGESLCRWKDNGEEPLLPGRFVESLENIGYITELDFYIYEKTLQAMAQWKELGYQLIPLSVNFSRKHFDGNGIFRRVKRLADEYGIEHKYIEIELTENLLAQKIEKVIDEMTLLRNEGFKVDIDDFGSGFSSLGMLLEIPADVVKIDKSFLTLDDKKQLENRKDFMTNLAKLMQSTNEEVVCEGVETEDQVEFLLDCGFKIGQGYLCDKPIPCDEFRKKYITK